MHIRHYGILANCKRAEKLARCRALLGGPPAAAPVPPVADGSNLPHAAAEPTAARWPRCGGAIPPSRMWGGTRHATKRRQRSGSRPLQWFTPADFVYDADAQTCICPAGEKLYRSGVDVISAGYHGAHFKAPKRACAPCGLRRQCLRHPERTGQRQVLFIAERVPGMRRPTAVPSAIEAVKRKINTPRGRWIYSRRMATVGPVFANLQNKGLRRFALRGRRKVSTQWKLFTLVHNIEKIATRKAA